MNTAQIHLALNHLPVIIVPVAVVLFLAGTRANQYVLCRAAAWALIFAGLSTIPTYLSGEGTEEMVEHLSGVAERTIEAHEDAALISAVAIALTALVAMGWLVRHREGAADDRRISAALIASAIVTTLLMMRTAHSGGLIRHPELTDATAPAEHHDGKDDD